MCPAEVVKIQLQVLGRRMAVPTVIITVVHAVNLTSVGTPTTLMWRGGVRWGNTPV